MTVEETVANQEAVNPETSEDGADAGTHDEPKKPNPIKEKFDRLTTKLDQKDAEIEAAKAEKSEAVKKTERKWAKKVYGEDVFDSDEYKAVAEKYPDMDIEDQMKFIGKSPSTQPTNTATPWRGRSGNVDVPNSIDLSELNGLRKTNPEKFKEIDALAKQGRVKVTS